MKKYNRYVKKTQKRELKYKKKEGYRLKQGASGSMRWHKINSVSPGVEDAPTLAPSPFPSYRRKSDDVGQVGISPKASAMSPEVILRRGRYQASRTLNMMQNAASELNTAQKEVADKTLSYYVEDNAPSFVKRAIADKDEWMPDNTFGLGGIGSQHGVGLRHVLVDYDRKLKEIQTQSDKMKQFATIFNNPDMTLTPGLPSMYTAMIKEQDRDTQLYKRFLFDSAGTGQVSVDTSMSDSKRVIAARVLDRLPITQSVYSNHLHNQEVDYPIFADERVQVPITRMLANRTSRSLSMRGLTGSFSKSEQKKLEALASVYTTRDSPDKSLVYGYRKYISDEGMHMDRQEYHDSLNIIGRGLDRIGTEDTKYGDIIKDLLRTNLDRHVDKQTQMAAGSRFFTSIVANKFIDSLGIEDKDTGKPRAQFADPNTSASSVMKALKKAFNNNNEIFITDDSSYVNNSMGIGASGGIWINAERRLPSHYTANQGKSVVGLDYNPGSIGHVTERIMPGYDSVALHESIHALDHFTGTLAGAVANKIPTNIARYLDKNNESKGGDDLGYLITKMESPTFESDNHLEITNVDAAKKKIMLRLDLSRQIANAAEYFINRNDKELVFYQNHSKLHEPGYKIDMPDSLVDLHPSPLFFLPEFNRLSYVLTGNRKSTAEPEAGAGSVDNNFFVRDQLSDAADAPQLNAETITVLTEYAIGKPHVLEAMDSLMGTNLRRTLNEYYGFSVVQKSDPVLLANARVNLIAAMENPDSIYKGYVAQAKRDAKKYGLTPYQGKIDISDVAPLPYRKPLKKDKR